MAVVTEVVVVVCILAWNVSDTDIEVSLLLVASSRGADHGGKPDVMVVVSENGT